MANTLASLVSTLRGVLLDQVAPYQWPDSALQHAVQEACGEYSYLFPRRVYFPIVITAGQQTIDVYAQDWLSAGTAGPVATSPDNADLISIERVELPQNTVLPVDVEHIVDPTLSGSKVYQQAWRWPGGATIYFRNAFTAADAANKVYVTLLQTYSQPDAAGLYAWNGPMNDLPLVLLLAERRAYGLLAGWQLRDQEAPKIDAAKILTSLDAAIKEAIAIRKRRSVRSRTLDV